MKHSLFIKWLLKPLRKQEPHISHKYILDLFILKMYEFIDKESSLNLRYSEKEFSLLFYMFVYSQKTNPIIYDLEFIITHSADIVDMFHDFQDISKSFGSNLFQGLNQTSDSLSQFLMNTLDVYDIQYSDEEDNDHYNYNEAY